MSEEPEEGGGGWDRKRTVWTVIGGVLVAGVIALLVVGLLNKDIGTSIQDALAAGERPDAPDATLPVLLAGDGVGPEGAQTSLESLRGKVVVLNFWASWCPPCEAEAPVLEQVADRYRDGETSPEVVVLGVDVQDLRERALGFIEDHDLTYPTLRDPDDGVKNRFQVLALPETFVIDQQGRIALKVAGNVTKPEDLTTAVDQLLEERG